MPVLPKQARFITNDSPECGYSGAWGAGKSRALCIKTVTRASRPGAREGLCRSTNVALRDTTLRTLLEPEGDLPPVLPDRLIKSHNKVEQRIKLVTGGEIMYFGIKDPQQAAKGGQSKHGSLNLTGCNIDESVELTEREYHWIKSRVRMNVRGVARQMNWVTNPGPPSHFLAKRFGLALDYRAADGCWAIKTSALDNHFLPRDVVAYYESLDGLMHRRYVLGEWCGSDGLIYDKWDRQVHVRDEPHAEAVRVMVGVDEGYTDPFAAVRIEIDGDGRMWVSDEVYETQWQRGQKVDAVRRLADGAERVVVDSAAPELITAMREAGIPARKCKKGAGSIFDGIMAVSDRLGDPGDGVPRLSVSSMCLNLIREFESYEWREEREGRKGDTPKPGADHALDALRYAVQRVDGASWSAAATGADPDREERREAYADMPMTERFAKARAEDPDYGFEEGW